MLRYLPFLLVLALWIYAFIDCLNTPEKEVRHLPKVVWVIIVLLFGEVLIGPVAWLVVGKVRGGPRGGSAGSGGLRGGRPKWTAPDDNPEFLASLRDDNKAAKADKADEKKDAPSPEATEAREADLRRREEELKRRESGNGPGTGPDDAAPPKA
ncbi:PLD nuclease N-terminal domain-containing protein [Streptomyces sp. 21So2-11]|uniref:PLD nuclease N-terminal domain-containing protein n=1 Tax=Streptomyces sp. 21So2-11 TaxID=3144408 RepID=UPI003218FFE4